MADKDFTFTSDQGEQATPDNAPDKSLPEDALYLKDTLSWAYANLETDATGNRRCPWCGNDFFFGKEAEFEATIQNHWLDKHRKHLEMTHFNPELGWDAYAIMTDLKKMKDEEAATSKEGLEVLDELDKYDILYLPEEMRHRANVEGGKFHWARPDRVQRYKDQGMHVVSVNDPKWSEKKGKLRRSLKHDHNREDSTMRANEMVAIYVPPVLYKDRERLKRARVAARGNPAASQEARQTEIGDVGKRAYEYYKSKQNQSHDEAMRMARQVEASVAAGTGSIQQEPGERRVVHKR